MDLDIQFHDSGLQSGLHIGHGLVVNDRRNFFQEKTEQGTRCKVADFLIHVFVEVALDGGDGRRARFLRNFDAHLCTVRGVESGAGLAAGSNWRLSSSTSPLAASSIMSSTSSKRAPSVR